jgi:hypothetical protein
MNIARMYTIALGSFGYTEDEARFLYLVAAHSGYFTCQQFLRFIDGKPGKRSTREVYLHAIPEDQRRAVANVEALLFGPKRTQIASASQTSA